MGEVLGAIIVGLICGATASAIVPGKTPGGIIGVILVGIGGGVVGQVLFAALGFRSAWWLGSLVIGVIGAVIVLLVLTRLRGDGV
jgi:uncharacterized membrane protein YeaQ/YmgE (transglycosylase-associated protein family)